MKIQEIKDKLQSGEYHYAEVKVSGGKEFLKLKTALIAAGFIPVFDCLQEKYVGMWLDEDGFQFASGSKSSLKSAI